MVSHREFVNFSLAFVLTQATTLCIKILQTNTSHLFHQNQHPQKMMVITLTRKNSIKTIENLLFKFNIC